MDKKYLSWLKEKMADQKYVQFRDNNFANNQNISGKLNNITNKSIMDNVSFSDAVKSVRENKPVTEKTPESLNENTVNESNYLIEDHEVKNAIHSAIAGVIMGLSAHYLNKYLNDDAFKDVVHDKIRSILGMNLSGAKSTTAPGSPPPASPPPSGTTPPTP